MEKTSDVSLGIHTLEVEITTRCNLNCKHCYSRNYKNIDLPISKFREVYGFANRKNVGTFVISGGEAILHPSFKEIVSFIRKTPHKFRLVLQSNGSLINNPEIIEKIRVFDLIHISFDLVNNIRIRSAKNLRLAKKLIAKGIKCYLFSTAHRKNRQLINLMVKKANNAKVPLGFNICVPTEELSRYYLMTKKEFVETEKKLYHLSQKNRILRYSSPLVAILNRNKIGRRGIRGGCTAGVAGCTISATGEIFPCPFFRVSAGNIFKDSLEKIWLESEFFKRIRNRVEFKDPCGSCKLLAFCGGCRKRAFMKSGDVQDSDPMCYKNFIKNRH